MAFVTWVLFKTNVASDLVGILKTWSTPKLLIPTLLLFACIGSEIVLGRRIGLWKHDLIKDSVVWVIGPAIGLFFGISDAGEKPHFFREAVLSTLKYSVFVEFYVNLVTFSLPIELVLVPVVTVITLLTVVAGKDEKFKPVRVLLNWVTALIGFGLLIAVSVRLAADWHHVDTLSDLRQLALPMWLTVGLMPYIFLLVLWATYGLLFVRINFATNDKKARRRAKVALAFALNFRTHRVGQFGGPWLHQIGSASTFSQARSVVRQYRHAG